MLEFDEIISIDSVDDDHTYDIWNYDQDCQDLEGGNFFVDGILVHNSIPIAIQNRDDELQSWRADLRKRHPIMEEILQSTLGVCVYQEQLTSLWQRLAGFTATEAQLARKDIAKKRVDKLKKIEEQWIEGASKTLGPEFAKEYWPVLETFGRYAFNRCLSKDTIIKCAESKISKSIEQWYNSKQKPVLYSYNTDDGSTFLDKCVDIHFSGHQEVFEITFENGKSEFVTLDHKFLCSDGLYHEVREIVDQGLDVIEINVS